MYKRLETPLAVQRWDLLQLDAPDGTRDPIVLKGGHREVPIYAVDMSQEAAQPTSS